MEHLADATGDTGRAMHTSRPQRKIERDPAHPGADRHRSRGRVQARPYITCNLSPGTTVTGLGRISDAVR
jgi:hypothetical protein